MRPLVLVAAAFVVPALTGVAPSVGRLPAPSVAPPGAAAAAAVLTGHVRDDAGAPIAGASVRVANAAGGATSGADGRYALSLGAAAYVRGSVDVEVRRAGYRPLRRTVRVAGDTVVADFALARATPALEATVATSDEARAGSAPSATAPSATAPSATAPAAANQLAKIGRGQPFVASRAAPSPWGVGAAAGTRVRRPGGEPNTEGYATIDDNPFLAVDGHPLSTFSVDVDRASYSNVRRFITAGQMPPKDAVRVEELVNYFPYAYPEPRGDEPFSVTTEAAPAPWNPAHQLVRVGLQARKIATEKLPPSNLVFLIDVSGSMMSPDKLPLVKDGFRLLVNQLRPQDRVAIVVYAGNAGLVLPSTSGAHKERILDAIDALEAGGSTAGGAGIALAYDVAREHFLPDGNNRVILATDGDFNVGPSSDAELVRLVERRRAEGTFLTVLGFGTGNLKDSRMEQLADRGNGHYAYVDGALEAKKVFVTELGGTLVTVAKDVKLQVEFNPARVGAYRLIGYENRLLRDEDFNDDAKDAGEVGAGHSVTALYEIVPKGREGEVVRGVDAPRYAHPSPEPAPAAHGGDELMFVKVRYKRPDGDRSLLLSHAVAARSAERPTADFTFAAAVAEFGMVLRDSPYRGSATLASAAALGRRSLGSDDDGYRAEFVRLVERAGGRELTATAER